MPRNQNIRETAQRRLFYADARFFSELPVGLHRRYVKKSFFPAATRICLLFAFHLNRNLL